MIQSVLSPATPVDGLVLEPQSMRREKIYVGTPEENARGVGLSRRTFFRYVAAGKQYDDTPPFHDPATLVEWYERMKARGAFTHRCPDSIKAAADQGKKTAAKNAPDQQPSATHPTGRMAGLMGTDDRRGLRFEIDELERLIASNRVAAQNAYRENDDDAGRRIISQVTDLMDKVTIYYQRLQKYEEAEQLTTRLEWIQSDLGSVLKAMQSNWRMEGRKFYGESRSPLPRTEFLSRWELMFGKFIRDLVGSKFAPAMELDAA